MRHNLQKELRAALLTLLRNLSELTNASDNYSIDPIKADLKQFLYSQLIKTRQRQKKQTKLSKHEAKNCLVIYEENQNLAHDLGLGWHEKA